MSQARAAASSRLDVTQLQGSTPGDVLARALHLRDEWRYDEVAALCDAESAAEYFRERCEACALPTIDQLRDDYPDATDEGLERIAAQVREMADRDRRGLVGSIAGVGSFDEVAALEPMEFLRRRLQRMDRREQVFEYLRAVARPVPDWLIHGVLDVRYEITGEEQVDETTIRISYRESVEAGGRTIHGPADFLLVRRLPTGEWRLVVQYDLLQALELGSLALRARILDLYFPGQEFVEHIGRHGQTTVTRMPWPDLEQRAADVDNRRPK